MRAAVIGFVLSAVFAGYCGLRWWQEWDEGQGLREQCRALDEECRALQGTPFAAPVREGESDDARAARELAAVLKQAKGMDVRTRLREAERERDAARRECASAVSRAEALEREVEKLKAQAVKADPLLKEIARLKRLCGQYISRIDWLERTANRGVIRTVPQRR